MTASVIIALMIFLGLVAVALECWDPGADEDDPPVSAMLHETEHVRAAYCAGKYMSVPSPEQMDANARLGRIEDDVAFIRDVVRYWLDSETSSSISTLKNNKRETRR